MWVRSPLVRGKGSAQNTLETLFSVRGEKEEGKCVGGGWL